MPAPRRQSLQHRRRQSISNRRQSLATSSNHQLHASYREQENSRVGKGLSEDPNENIDSTGGGSYTRDVCDSSKSSPVLGCDERNDGTTSRSLRSFDGSGHRDNYDNSKRRERTRRGDSDLSESMGSSLHRRVNSRDRGSCKAKEASRSKHEGSMTSLPHPSQFGVIPGYLMGQLWSDEAKVVFAAMRDLANIAGVDSDCIEDREVVNELGGPCIIIAVMMKWYRSPVITIDGLRALANLGANSDFRETSFNCGGLEVALTCMKNYPDDVYVQRNGCAAICRLCYDKDQNSVEFVEDYDGLSCLFHAIRTFPQNTAIQEFVITIMYGLTAIERLRYLVLESGIAEPLAMTAEMLQGKDDHRETWMKARVVLNNIAD